MIRPFGETAMLLEVAGPDRAQQLAAAIRERPIPGIVAALPGLSSLLLELDSSGADPTNALEQLLDEVPDEPLRGREVTIPVRYGGSHGPDLAEVATACGLSEEEVILRHAAAELRVLFLGFAPGFAYLGELPPDLRVPRLATPRTRTPAGSVAIAGPMSGIYPAQLPGGWRVIGRTDVVLFDANRDPPALLAAGDRVRFEPIPA